MTAVSHDKLRLIAAEIFERNSEDVHEVIIIAKGTCPDCGGHDEYAIADTFTEVEPFIEAMGCGIYTRMNGHT